jgi:PAS domain S-box-containing protein
MTRRTPKRDKPNRAPAPRLAALEAEVRDLREQLTLERLQYDAALESVADSKRDLEVSRERYVDLYDTAPVAYVLLDRNGFIHEANLTAARMFGMPRERLRHLLLSRFVCKEDRRTLLHHLSRCRRSAGDEDVTTEMTITGDEGRSYHVVLSSRTPSPPPLPLARVRFRSVLVDLTARKQAEQALRESEERYALVVAGSGGAVWDWNVREKRVLFSPSWKALRGLADDEVSEHETEWSSRIHPDDRERVMAAVRDHFEGRTAVFSEEYRVRHKDGRWVWIQDHGIAKRDSAGNVVRMAGSETDITARKGAEAALRESEERLGGILSSATDAIISVDDRQRVTLFNKAAEAMFGCAAAEAIGQPLDRFMPQRFRQAHRAQVEEFGRSGSTARRMGRAGMVYGLRANGQEFPAEASISRLKSGCGTFTTVILRDVTERNQSEEALRRAELRYRTIFEQVGTGMAQVNSHTGRFEQVNRQYCAIVGLTKEEMLATTFMSITHPDDLAEDLVSMERLRSGEISAFTMEKRYVRKDGSIAWVNLNVAPLWETGEPPTHHIAAVQDITERKEAEKALEQSREDLGRAQEVGQIGWWRLDLRRNVLTWSDETHRIFGVPKGTALTYEAFLELVHPADRRYVDDRWTAGLRGEPYDIEHRIVAEGRVKWVREKAYLEFDEEGVLSGGFGITQDITQRKEVELTLVVAKEQLQATLTATDIGTWRWDLTKNILVTDANLKRLFDLEAGEDMPVERYLERIIFDDRGRIEQALESVIREGGAFDELYRVAASDGTERWIHARGKVERDEGSAARSFSGVVLDITERKKAEQALRESEVRLLLALDGASMGTWEWDSETDLLLWNDRQFELFGIRPEDFYGTGAEALSRIHGDDRVRIAGALRRAMEEGVAGREEFRVVHADGSVHWLFGSGRPVQDERGRYKHVVGVNFDITEHRLAQEGMQSLNEALEARVRERTAALAEANERWDWVVRATNDGVWDWDLPHDTAYFSPRWKEMHGFQESDHPESMKAWSARIHPEDRHRVLGALDQYLEGKQSQFREEYRVERKDGIYFWVLDRGVAVFNDAGRAIRMIGAESDITWRKEVEETLRRNEHEFRTLADNVPALFSYIDRDRRYRFVNKRYEALFGRSDQELRGVLMQDLLGSNGYAQVRPYLERALAGELATFEYELKLPGDGRHHLAGQYVPDWDEQGQVIGVFALLTDITELKSTEVLLRERETQLRELGAKLLRAQEEERRRISRDLHDDVMQRMGALTLDLYGLVSSAASPEGELQSQLKACGASAEQLTTDLQRMAHQLHPSILEFVGLEVAVREQVREFAVRTGLSAELQTRNLPKNIPLDHATCLYRVLQEGLQNVQKHAAATTVLVRLLGTGRGVGLCVHDDGRGIEAGDGAGRRKGLGLTSMEERVGMLNGTFRIRTTPNAGTELHAWVPLEDVKREARVMVTDGNQYRGGLHSAEAGT